MPIRRMLAALPVHVLFAAAGACIGYVGIRLVGRFEAAVQAIGPLAWAILAWLCLGALALASAWLRSLRPAGRPRALALARGLGYCLMGGTLVCLVALQPFERLTAELAIGCAAAAWALGFAAWDRIAPRLPRRLLRVADLVLCNLTLLLFAAELGLRALARLSPSPLLVTDDARAVERIAAHLLRPGAPNWGFRANSLGFYDEEFLPPDRRRVPAVAMIGDSFQVGIVPHHHHFTTVCERELGGKARVYSVGVGTIGFLEYRHLLEHAVLPLRPEAVLVGVFVGNDFYPEVLRPQDSRTLRQWLDRDRVLVAVLARRLAAVAAGGRQMLAAADAARDARLSDDPAELQRLWPWLADHRLETPGMPAETFLDLERRIARSICVPGKAAWREGLDILLEMRRRAGAVRFGVVLIPDEFQVEDPLWEQVAGGLPEGADRFLAQRLVGEFLREQGIPWLDLLPALRSVPAEGDGRRHVYHLCDTHWNVRGNRVAGEEVARFVARLLERSERR